SCSYLPILHALFPIFPYTPFCRSRILSPISSVSSVGNGPSPTRVVYAFDTPTTLEILVGPTPEPMVTPPATGLDDVTNGYVPWRSEEHTSELQSRFDLVCRLLL